VLDSWNIYLLIKTSKVQKPLRAIAILGIITEVRRDFNISLTSTIYVITCRL
jgi:hypothetical protein